MNQNDPATFTLSDVSQLIYFISYTAPAAHGKQNTITTFCQLFFEILRPKNVPLLPVTRPTLKKFKFGNPNFVYYCTENDTTKKLLRGKMGEKLFIHPTAIWQTEKSELNFKT